MLWQLLRPVVCSAYDVGVELFSETDVAIERSLGQADDVERDVSENGQNMDQE